MSVHRVATARFDRGSSWLKSIVLSDEHETDSQGCLRFLNRGMANGTPDATVIFGYKGYHWRISAS